MKTLNRQIDPVTGVGSKSSDNRQMIHWIRQTALTLTCSGRQLDHRRFVNWFAVMVTSAALNPSTSHRANTRCQLGQRHRTERFLESSEATSPDNLPIISRFVPRIYRFAGFRARG